MRMIHTFDLSLTFQNSKQAQAVVDAFNPEEDSAHEKNAKTRVRKVKNDCVQLTVQASQKAALRASTLNATQFLDLAVRLIEN